MRAGDAPREGSGRQQQLPSSGSSAPVPKVVPAEEARLLIETCPAFAVAPELRLDTLFPSFARGFLNPDHCSVTLGLSSMTCHWDDATFATLEGEPSDVLLAPTPFDNLDEFLAVADAAIAKGYSSDIQRGWHTHFIFPSELPEDAAERLERVRARYHTDPIAAYGTQKSFHRFTELEKAEATSALAAKGFSFAAMFPKTTQQFTSGRFRWIKYSRGVLKVAVGRGTGKLSRSCEERNLLREWRLPFGSLHELMCAAEQSWVLPSSDPPQPLGEMLLPQDSDLGPSDPQPDVLASPANFRSLPTGSLPGSPKVTALAFGDGAARSESLHLYSGHSDGTVAKWDLKSDKLLWKIQAHEPRAILEDEEDDEYSDMEGPLSNAMVCGLLVHPSGREVYSWAREAVVKNWDAMSGAALRQFDCTPALEEHGFRWQDDPVGAPSPNVNCAVLARLGTCGDALLVGLHALGAAPDEGGCVADGDKPPGNVMPFELATAMQMPTWRGHTFPVSAIAVVNDKG